MPTIEQSNQPEDQTKDEKSSPSSDESGSSATEAIQTKQSGKVAVKKKTVRKAARKKAAQTTGRQIQDEQSNSSATETKQTTQPGKVAVKKKTVRKKAAKKKTAQTKLKQIQLEPASESDKAAASLVVNAAGKTAPATQNQPEKPVENAATPRGRDRAHGVLDQSGYIRLCYCGRHYYCVLVFRRRRDHIRTGSHAGHCRRSG